MKMPPQSFLMNWENRGQDRRAAARFEIVGGLAGAMTVATEVQICNLSRCGALVLTPGPLALNSRCKLRVQLDSPFELEASVRRVVPRYATNDFHVGLEFMAADGERIEQVLSQATASRQ